MRRAALGDASDTMMKHPLALQLRSLQSLVEIGVDKNATVVFPAPLMSTIGELGTFLAREAAAATAQTPPAATSASPTGRPVTLPPVTVVLPAVAAPDGTPATPVASRARWRPL